MKQKTKKCTLGTCGKEKPLEQMVKNCSMKDGYTNICKVCKRDRDKMTRSERLEKGIEKPYVSRRSIGSASSAKQNIYKDKFDCTWCGSSAIYN